MTKSNIIVALDFKNMDSALRFCDQIDPNQVRVKVGKELFTVAGPEIIKRLNKIGFDIFLDMKFHDIPNTVSGAIRAAADLGVWMCNIHALGGHKAMDAAAKVMQEYGKNSPIVIAVTLLTSMDQEQMNILKLPVTIKDFVKHLAKLCYERNIDGVVCSAQESLDIKRVTDDSFLTVTPGIRLSNNNVSNDDQFRIITPRDAIKNKVDYMVIGRPITQSDNPQKVILEIINSL